MLQEKWLEYSNSGNLEDVELKQSDLMKRPINNPNHVTFLILPRILAHKFLPPHLIQ